jgi:hypothetical protein
LMLQRSKRLLGVPQVDSRLIQCCFRRKSFFL